METKLQQRDPVSCLVNTADIVRAARKRADDAAWHGHPNAHRLEREAQLLEARYGDGETMTPLF